MRPLHPLQGLKLAWSSNVNYLKKSFHRKSHRHRSQVKIIFVLDMALVGIKTFHVFQYCNIYVYYIDMSL